MWLSFVAIGAYESAKNECTHARPVRDDEVDFVVRADLKERRQLAGQRVCFKPKYTARIRHMV